MSTGLTGEGLFFELARQDLTRAADHFTQVHERTAGNDGFVSLEVSSLLAYDTKGSAAAATTLHKKANRPNLFIKIPGTKEGNIAIEEAIAGGVAINVTLNSPFVSSYSYFCIRQAPRVAWISLSRAVRLIGFGRTSKVCPLAQLAVSRSVVSGDPESTFQRRVSRSSGHQEALARGSRAALS